MMARSCCVKLCFGRSHDHRGRRRHNGLTFHRFPAWRRNEGRQVCELTRRRRAAWVEAVGRSDVTFSGVPSSARVCSRHFLSGRPAYEMLESDPDWVPSLHLGRPEHQSPPEPRSCCTQTNAAPPWRLKTSPPPLPEAAQSQSDAAAGIQRSAAPPWAELRAELRAELQVRSTKRRREEVDPSKRPAGRRTDASFRDFFTAALEASLRASVRSRAESRSHTSSSSSSSSSSCSFKLPALEEEAPSSSRCVDCVRLQARIQELEDTLSGQTAAMSERGEEQEEEQEEEEQQEEEQEEVSQWAAPLSPGQDSLLGSGGSGGSSPATT